jgi:hypothetical protein
MRYVSLVLVLAWSLFAVPALAQDEEETPAPPEPETVRVEYGGRTFQLPADEPLVTCVVGTSADFEGQYTDVIVWVRHLDGTFRPLGSYSTRATAALANKPVSACIGLAP